MQAFNVTQLWPGIMKFSHSLDRITSMFFLKGAVTRNYVISLYPKCPKSSLRMKLSNNHLNLLNNIKEIQQKERKAWMDTTSWTRLKPDCILVMLKMSRPYVFLVYGKSPALKAVFAQNRLVCDATMILSVTELHITILEF